LACGELIAPLLRRLAAELGEVTGMDVQVVAVGNRFFGSTVTVSGLLTGADVIEALRGRELGERLWLPRTMFDDAGEVTLDDLRLADVGEALGVDVGLAERLSKVVEQNEGSE
jgi:NifB/MoaA-like Fe-S oxidoreductase